MGFTEEASRIELPAPSTADFAVSAGIFAAITLLLVVLLANERRVYRRSLQRPDHDSSEHRKGRASAIGRAIVWSILLVMSIVANFTLWTGEGFIAVVAQDEAAVFEYRLGPERRIPWTKIDDVRLMRRGKTAILEVQQFREVLASCRVEAHDAEEVERLREAGRLLRSRLASD